MTAPEDSELHDSGKVGFRDIYRAVGESETRIKEHISLVLLPISTQLADHESRLVNHEGRIKTIEDKDKDEVSAGRERRRIGDISGKALAVIILVSNFILGLIVMFANLLSAHPAP